MKEKHLTTKYHEGWHEVAQRKIFVFLCDDLRALCGEKNYEIKRQL
ncbi:Hypothetical protein IALB_2810 [Ignavibacterium album JCM 16511]|uniref:Uncharacterized protein n=1 Tax=Ignavibacterium album (strain DSM 19864 / JCM 16511 / NBRC 101810 / Mat9-16) TaxID=945713 RepID=I0ANF6_IGNAJ|nr:hypothetical protein [Ignavibacterium album]AFH50513.1 Hypothetical protein IALB_2810 [Ignavibacterium album JCM 16511]